MKELTEIYQAVVPSFRAELARYAETHRYVTIQYSSDIREYLSTKAVIKEIFSRNGADFLVLSTGEEIRLDRIIRVEGKPAPGYEDYFTCEC